MRGIFAFFLLLIVSDFNIHAQDLITEDSDSLYALAGKHYFIGNYDELIKVSEKSLRLHVRAGDFGRAVISLTDIGNAYFEKGNHVAAFDYFYKAGELIDSTREESSLFYYHLSTGIAYLKLGFDYDANTFLYTALDFCHPDSTRILASIHYDLGMSHYNIGDYKIAASEYVEAANASIVSDRSKFALNALENAGYCYFLAEEYISAFNVAWDIENLLINNYEKADTGFIDDFANSLHYSALLLQGICIKTKERSFHLMEISLDNLKEQRPEIYSLGLSVFAKKHWKAGEPEKALEFIDLYIDNEVGSGEVIPSNRSASIYFLLSQIYKSYGYKEYAGWRELAMNTFSSEKAIGTNFLEFGERDSAICHYRNYLTEVLDSGDSLYAIEEFLNLYKMGSYKMDSSLINDFIPGGYSFISNPAISSRIKSIDPYLHLELCLFKSNMFKSIGNYNASEKILSSLLTECDSCYQRPDLLIGFVELSALQNESIESRISWVQKYLSELIWRGLSCTNTQYKELIYTTLIDGRNHGLDLTETELDFIKCLQYKPFPDPFFLYIGDKKNAKKYYSNSAKQLFQEGDTILGVRHWLLNLRLYNIPHWRSKIDSTTYFMSIADSIYDEVPYYQQLHHCYSQGIYYAILANLSKGAEKVAYWEKSKISLESSFCRPEEYEEMYGPLAKAYAKTNQLKKALIAQKRYLKYREVNEPNWSKDHTNYVATLDTLISYLYQRSSVSSEEVRTIRAYGKDVIDLKVRVGKNREAVESSLRLFDFSFKHDYYKGNEAELMLDLETTIQLHDRLDPVEKPVLSLGFQNVYSLFYNYFTEREDEIVAFTKQVAEAEFKNEALAITISNKEKEVAYKDSINEIITLVNNSIKAQQKILRKTHLELDSTHKDLERTHLELDSTHKDLEQTHTELEHVKEVRTIQRNYAFVLTVLLLGAAIILFFAVRSNVKSKKKEKAQNEELRKVHDRLSYIKEHQSHSIKNSFQKLISYIEQKEDDPSLSEYGKDQVISTKKIVSGMQKVNELLYGQIVEGNVDCKPFFESILDAFQPQVFRVIRKPIDYTNFPSLQSTAFAQDIGLILNELVENSLKHRGDVDDYVELNITMKIDSEQTFVFSYTDDLSPLPFDRIEDIPPGSSGLRLIHQVVEDKQGTFTMSIDQKRPKFSIRLNMEKYAEV